MGNGRADVPSSEVYKAYDLDTNQFCAVKIHELGKEMTDQQRRRLGAPRREVGPRRSVPAASQGKGVRMCEGGPKRFAPMCGVRRLQAP